MCGQAPGFDGGYPQGIDEAGAAQPFGVFLGDEIVGHHGKVDASTLQFRDQRLDQRGLARADRSADADPGRRRYDRGRRASFFNRLPHRSPQHVALRERHFASRFAGRKYTIDENIEGLRIDADLWTGIVPQHVAL